MHASSLRSLRAPDRRFRRSQVHGNGTARHCHRLHVSVLAGAVRHDHEASTARLPDGVHRPLPGRRVARPRPVVAARRASAGRHRLRRVDGRRRPRLGERDEDRVRGDVGRLPHVLPARCVVTRRNGPTVVPWRK